MSQIEISRASQQDDAALTAIMSSVPVPGKLSVTFARRPSYFLGSSVQGEDPHVFIAREQHDGSVVGVGARLEKQLYINGAAHRCGYLCDLRIEQAYRSRTLLARGYRMLRKLEETHPLPLSLTVVYGDNVRALQALQGSRAGLPAYRYWGKICTPALFLDQPKRALTLKGITCTQAQRCDLPEIHTFLAQELALKQFAPVIPARFLESSQFRGLEVSDLYLAREHGRLVGVIAAWDQASFRQVVIGRYPAALGVMRPIYNALAPLFAMRQLPGCGEEVRYFYLALIAIRDNSVELFRALLRFLYRERRAGPWSFCVVGLHERDPLCEALQEYRRIDAFGHLFLVQYTDLASQMPELDARVPYFEMACA